MEALTSFFDNFDLAKFVPPIDAILSKLVPIMTWSVVIGPVILLVLGLVYLFLPPKEANHRFGFRTWFGMGSVEAWRFTQKLAGSVWTVLGLALLAVSILISNKFPDLEPMAMLDKAAVCILWQIVLIFVLSILITLVVTIRYDRNGYLRSEKRKKEK